MTKFKMLFYLFCVSIFVSFFCGCAAKKILIECYMAPKEYKKIEGLIYDGSSDHKGKYLTVAINPEVSSQIKGKDIKTLGKLLIKDVKEKITETNFISLYPVFELSPIGVVLEILDYNYNITSNEIESNLIVNFVISKGITEYYSKSFSANDKRYSKNRLGLPSKHTILKNMSKKCAKSFVNDISPLKTKQLRELKSLPGDIEYVLDYTIRKNYEGAIEAMEKYTGDKNMNFFYNLAVFYEALAGEKEDLTLLKEANKNYKLSMANGGNKDDVVISAKARFDVFFKLLKMVEGQQNQNIELEEENEDNFGIKY